MSDGARMNTMKAISAICSVREFSMRAVLGAGLVALVVTGALAQGTFTIRKPIEGSVVRETVTIRIPKNSVPDTGYVGFFVDGKFLEAVKPDIQGNDYIYRLNTKARAIPDGKANIEAVLYIDLEDGTRIANRSSINVIVDNSKSIKTPRGGFKLRYKFTPGVEWVYSVQREISYATSSGRGARAAEQTINDQKFRLLFAIDNAYKTSGGRDGLLRIQALPLKGKNYLYYSLAGSEGPQRWDISELAPIYMRLTSTGREVFGSIPFTVPMMGEASNSSFSDLVLTAPLPVLPSKGVKVGDPWQAAWQRGSFPHESPFEGGKLTASMPARGELKAIEWEMGVPCARIENTISAGGVSLKETYWFALNRGVIMKAVQEYSIEQKLGSGQSLSDLLGEMGGSRSGANAGSGGAPGMSGSSGGGSGGPTRGGVGSGGDDGGGGDFIRQGQNGSRGMYQKGGGMVAPESGGRQQGRPGGRGFGGGRGAPRGGASDQPVKVTIRLRQTMILEK